MNSRPGVAWANSPGNRESIISRLGVSDVPDLVAEASTFATTCGPRHPRSLRIEAPDGTRRPDSFYRKVAELYGFLAGRSRSPAAEIAQANGLPVTTVHRWVKEARRRGFLPPGRRGRAG